MTASAQQTAMTPGRPVKIAAIGRSLPGRKRSGARVVPISAPATAAAGRDKLNAHRAPRGDHTASNEFAARLDPSDAPRGRSDRQELMRRS